MLDNIHMVVRAGNLNVLAFEIRLEPGPEPVVCRETANKECNLETRINVTNQFESETHSSRCCCRFLLQLECVNDSIKGFIEETGGFFTVRQDPGDQRRLSVDGVGRRKPYPVNLSFPNEMLYFGALVRRPATLT